MQKKCCQSEFCLHERFLDCGCRLTVPRKVILDILGNSAEHLSTEEIYMKVHKKNKNIGLTTIYRTLELLVKLKILYRFDFGEGRARYEIASEPGSPHHHHHLICTKCNSAINYKDFVEEELKLVKLTEKSLAKKYNFVITNHNIHYFGICEVCRKKK